MKLPTLSHRRKSVSSVVEANGFHADRKGLVRGIYANRLHFSHAKIRNDGVEFSNDELW